jgi:N-acyl-D-amino-acid deacylase
MAELVLRGGTVIDGTGSPPQHADVVVRDGRIAAVNQPGGRHRSRVLDVSGLTVCPGFIDLHTHCDFTLPRFPRADAMLRQGVTTLVLGNCGLSPFPVGPVPYDNFLSRQLDFDGRTAREYVTMLECLPLAVNVAVQVGHGSVRAAVMGLDDRPPTDRELDRMRAEVAAAFESGAVGLSSGLIYPPGTYADTAELVALAEVAASYGGFYSTHLRNEGPALLKSMREALDIAARSGAALQLSHHKALGTANWGLTARSLELLDAARSDGMDVLADQYPYTATSTTLAALVPPWVAAGGDEQLRQRLADPEIRSQVRAAVLSGTSKPFEPNRVLVAAAPDTRIAGRRLDEIADDTGTEPVDTLLDLLQRHGATVESVVFGMHEADVRRVLRHPCVAVASDGWTLHPDAGGVPHPRSYGTFARVLGHYVREEDVLSFEQAVRKMTALPALRLRHPDLGVIRPGARADLAIIDTERVGDRATYTQPHQMCVGVHHVVVNGELVIEHGRDTGAAAGRILNCGLS